MFLKITVIDFEFWVFFKFARGLHVGFASNDIVKIFEPARKND
jgi:hypothetical protein